MSVDVTDHKSTVKNVRGKNAYYSNQGLKVITHEGIVVHSTCKKHACNGM